jgi:ATP-binding cassette subfamily C protein LapB
MLGLSAQPTLLTNLHYTQDVTLMSAPSSPDAPLNQDTPPKENWRINSPHTVDDPLLGCLYLLAKFYNKSFTEEALKAGLPLENHKLAPDIFVRAAERAGLTAKIVRRPIEKIKSLAMPAILLLKDQQACVLLGVRDGQAEIMQPEAGASKSQIAIAELQAEYTGHAIFIRPSYTFSERSEELSKTNPRHWFWSILWRSWPAYGEVILASFLINMLGLALPLFSMNIYDRVVPNHAIETLWVLVLGVSIVFFFEFLLRTLRGYLIDIAGKNIDLNLSARIFEQVLGLKMAVRPSSVGAFVNTVQGFEFFRDFITSSTIAVLIDIPFVFLYIAVIAMVGGSLALIPLITVPLIILVGYILQLPLEKLSEESYKHAAEKQATLIETLGGMEAIKSEGAESILQRKWEQVVGMAARIAIKLRLISNSSINFSILAQELTSILVVILGVYKIADGQITMGALIACTILSGRALAPMSQVAALVTRYHQSMQALEGLNKVMDLPVERPRGKSPLHRPNLAGNIQFRQVSFQYPNQKLKALTDVSFNIKSGERVAILGRIGSGKTTITKLILGLYQPTSGSTLMDGTELQQIDPADLRHNIGYVPQDVVLFYGSVKNNMTLGAPYIDDEAILRAGKIAGVDRFVSLHPEGYDWQVGERGMYLSGGQRQSIVIARAILADPKLLLMDEPTNQMDEMTETQLKNSLMNYIQGKTLILMTHKPSLLSLVDRLIILEGGHLVVDGPKDQVLKALAEGKVKVPQVWSPV